ncbi:hypothetical protein niasHT_004549 [Heterodera trifolii]|uniref:Uncharacterized protein n=1 Tax=Heterodera trifolii TaxID=157864 RepID=A0ABD2M095_9BILA
MERLTFKLCIDYLISKGQLVEGGRFRLHASHGLQFLKSEQIEHYYPNKFVQLTKQIYVLNTLFNLPEAYLFTRLVDFDKFGQCVMWLFSENKFLMVFDVAEHGYDINFRKREHAKTEQVVGRDGGRRKKSDERHRRLTAGARRAPANQSTACGSRADFFRSP